MKLLLFLVACVGFSRAKNDWETVTALDDYVNRPEASYNFEKLETYVEDDLRVLIYRMDSLTWFDDTLTTMPDWYHQMAVIIPNTMDISDKALLYISNGNWNDSLITNSSGVVMDGKMIARALKAVVGIVKQVPFQPIYFQKEGGDRPRSEDAIIGYTWKLFIEGDVTNPEVIALFPMTKAAYQAARTVETVALQEAGLTITNTMPTGFSKRGWTTWLLGCVDQSVFAMAPTVFDLLNFHENLHHHYQSLGGWSWAFTSYFATNITRYLDDDKTLEIGQHIDPLEYNARLTMPKLLSGATADQFFLPDGTHYWWDVMNGEKHYSIHENDDHSVGNHRTQLWNNVIALFHDAHYRIPRPSYDYSYRNGTVDCNITLTSAVPVESVQVWTADSTIVTCEPHNTTDVRDIDVCRRDFRAAQFAVPLETNIVWNSSIPEDLGNNSYTVTVPQRSDSMQGVNFRITHMQMTYLSGKSGYPYTLSSQTQIIPDILPFPRCQTPEECQGELK